MATSAPLLPKPELYPGPLPFAIEQANVFFGRTREIADLVNLVLTYHCVVLYAESGAGKTSLVNAGLIPALRGKMQPILRARVGGDIAPGIPREDIKNIFAFQALSSALAASTKPSDLLSSKLKMLASDSTGAEVPGLIIFDQFEEVFTNFPERWEHREKFFEQLSELLPVKTDQRPLKPPSPQNLPHLLLVIREDHLAQLEFFARFDPYGFRIRYGLKRLSADQAREAIIGPLSNAGRTITKEAANQLIENLQQELVYEKSGPRRVPGEFVEPLHLQLVCRELWQTIPSDMMEIGETAVQKFANVDQTLASFYDRAVARAVRETSIPESRLRSWIDQELVTPGGTRAMVFMGADQTAGMPNSVIDVLDQEHIIRPERRAGSTWYELTHDRFLGPIQKANLRWQAAWRQTHALRISWAVTIAFVLLLAVSLSAYYLIAREKAAELATEKARHAKQQEQASQQIQEATSKLESLAQTTAAFGLAQWKAGHFESAKNSFDALKRADALEGINAIDAVIARAEEQHDASLQQYLSARTEYLRDADQFANQSPGFKEYLCQHNFYVIAASERSGHAALGRAYWRKQFPRAEIGPRASPNDLWVPVIVDFFLTCRQAKQRAEEIRTLPSITGNPGHPWVNSWFRDLGCSSCR